MLQLAVCAIFKDEAPFLEEWVAYHRQIGVDHFFLYDNGSSDGGCLVFPKNQRKHITTIPWPHRPGQMAAYQNFTNIYARCFEWVAFIDLDEFLHPTEADSLTDLLPLYDSYSAVLVHWLNFGPGGHDRRPSGLVLENYLFRLPNDFADHRHVKSIVRTRDLVHPLGVHVFQTSGSVCNSRAEPVPNESIQTSVCHEVLCLNHYYTKSREDWDLKLKRGRADVESTDPQFERNASAFETYAEQALVKDVRITRFVPQVSTSLDLGMEHDAMAADASWISQIHAADPYENFPIADWAEDRQGWGYESPIFEHVIATYRPGKIVEVGSWKGASAITMANLIKIHGCTGCQIICIDTWLGSLEHWLNREDRNFFPSLNLKWGRPSIYLQFLANVIYSGNNDIIVPFPISSISGAKFLEAKGLFVDAVYIDGGHYYDEVLSDLKSFWKVLSSGGIFFGDCYVLGWIGVVRAVHDFAASVGVEVDVSFGHKWLMKKP